MTARIATKALSLSLLAFLVGSVSLAAPPPDDAPEKLPAPDPGAEPPAPRGAADAPEQEPPKAADPSAAPDRDGTPPADATAAPSQEDAAGAPADAKGAATEPAEGAAPEAPAAEARPQKPQTLDEAVAGLDHTGTPEKPAADGEPRDTGEDEPLAKGERRKPIDYDGRPDPGTDAGDIVRWGPRILFFPIYAVLEYGLRIPIVWTTTRIEQYYIADRIVDFFTWDDGRARLYPLISVDFGVRANVGFTFKWKEAFPRHDFAATGFVGFDELYSFSGTADQKIFRDEEALLRWAGGYSVAPDNVFYGLSNVDARCNDFAKGCRFRSMIVDASLGLVGWENRLNSVFFTTAFRHARFTHESSDSPPLTDEEAAVLPGFADGYQIIEPRIAFALDTRDEDLDFHTGTGVRLEAMSAFALDVANPDSRWFRASAEAGGFYDLGFGQVLSGSFFYEGLVNASSHLDGERPPVPFYELPFMGGTDQMKGFLKRRMVGENALALNLEYRYPIASLIDAAVFGSYGNTFRDLSTWDVAANYLTYGLALKTGSDRASFFEAIIAWGSNRIDEPSFEPFDQFRLSVGVNRGF